MEPARDGVRALVHATHSELVARYAVSNLTDQPQSLQLVLAVRPFQVNPPTQFLRSWRGQRHRALEWDGTTIWVNDRATLMPLRPPDRFAASAFESGAIPHKLLARARSRPSRVNDEIGVRVGALIYKLELAPRGSRNGRARCAAVWRIRAADSAGEPFESGSTNSRAPSRPTGATSSTASNSISRQRAQHYVDTLRSSLAHILMTRDGPILRPGTRSYGALVDPRWRDDVGSPPAARIRGYRRRLPALVRAVPVRQRQGALLRRLSGRRSGPGERQQRAAHLSRRRGLSLHARPRAAGGRCGHMSWPQPAIWISCAHRSAAARNLTRERRMLFGLLPPSISHEGYASKPAYSYWDVFWGLRGYKDAVAIAWALGKSDAARQFAQRQAEFRSDVHASLRSTATAHGVDFVPGAADLGDFDATSTTIALAPGGEEDIVPADLLRETFERYWRNFTDRREGLATWNDYTPYELRVVGTFVRLGWRERARELLEFLFKDQRPAGWNQWAEVVGREPRRPRFIGDMPHAWVASDYISSVLDMFVHERQADGALVLAKGIPDDWVGSSGFSVKNLRTPYGRINLSFRPEGTNILIEISGDANPPGGFILPSPWAHLAKGDSDNGSSLRDGELHIAHLPVRIRVKKTDQG